MATKITVDEVTQNVTVTVSNERGPSGESGGGSWGTIGGTLSDQTDLQAALDLKAPLASPTFTGTVTADHIHGNLAGSVYMHIRAGEALSKGDPVFVSGSHGTGSAMVPIVMRADASDPAKMPAIAIMDAAVAHNANGHAVTNGVISDLNTAAYSINATLYVANGGGMTATKPANAQPVARVERSNTNNGGIVVKVNGLYSDVSVASSQVTDATSEATPNTVVKRDENGGGVLFYGNEGVGAVIESATNTGAVIESISGVGAFIGGGNTGATIFSNNGDGAKIFSNNGTYHARFGLDEFANSGNNRSFIERVRGALGWFRGAFKGRIHPPDILTEDCTWTLPDATGTLALTNDARFTDQRVPTDNSATNAKLADMAAGTVKGRAIGAGTGDPQDLTTAQQLALSAAAFNAGAEDTTPAGTDRLAVTTPTAGWITLTRVWDFIKAQLDTAPTIAGEKSFSGQVQLTNQSATDANSAMTRGLADARYASVLFAANATAETVANNASNNASAQSAVTLAPGTYQVEVLQVVGSTSAVGSCRAGTAFTGTATASRVYVERGGSTNTDAANITPSYDGGFWNWDSPILFNSGGNRSGIVKRSFLFVVTAQGVLANTYGQAVAEAAQSATLRIGSYVKATRIN